MGLDGVELVMGLEEEFGIEFSDADAERMQTPRDVIDHIMRTVYGGQKRCTSRAGFYQFRRACVSALGVPRNQVRPDTQLTMLMPAANIQTAWSQLREAMGMDPCSWPHLEYPKVVSWLRMVVFLSTMTACIASGGYFHLLAGCLMFFLSFPIAILVDHWLTQKFAHRQTILPEKLVTIANLIDAVVPQEWMKAEGIITQWDRERVALKVKEIVIDQLGIDEKQYHEDARFIEDFGVG